jgi:hypothetical protein
LLDWIGFNGHFVLNLAGLSVCWVGAFVIIRQRRSSKQYRPLYGSLVESDSERRERKGKKMSIYKKILEVQKAVDAIPKSGYNNFNKYAYATEADVLRVKELMNTHGLIAFPSTESFETYNRGDSFGIIQHIEYTVVDVESNESIKVKVLGQGEDKGDKGAYKASTGANKYFYLKFAGAPTGDDPERDQEPEKKSYRGQAGQQHKYKKSSGEDVTRTEPSPQALARINAKKILDLQSQAGLSNEEVLQVGGIESLKALADAGEAEKLSEAYMKLAEHVRKGA